MKKSQSVDQASNRLLMEQRGSADQYSATIAAHYAAYRPPLHGRILERALAAENSFSSALDVGCGTGCSSVALAQFCESVFAIDPSTAMLESTAPHQSITYQQGSAEDVPLPDGSIDIAAFAGSLSYANLDATVAELRRVCRSGALLVVYDFAVLIDKVLQGLDFEAPDSAYNYGANFSSISSFNENLSISERIQFPINAAQLAHLILANVARHEAFAFRFNTSTPFADLAEELGPEFEDGMIEADIFYSVYRLISPKDLDRRPN